MKKNPNLLWVIAIVLGWSFDLLFWGTSFGINFAIFMSLCLVTGFLLLWFDRQHPARGTLWLIPLIVLCLVVTFLRAEPMTVFLGVLFTLFLMGVLTHTFLGGRWLDYSLADYASGFMNLIGSMIVRPILFSTEVRREREEGKIPARRFNPWPILRGVLIAIPIIAIFAALLTSADAIFNDQVGSFLKLFFNLDKLPEYIFRLCYILFFAYLLAGIFLHAASQSRDEKLIGKEKPLISRFLGFTEAAIVMGSVIVLFSAFVIVQFRYFFGGQANITIAGFTYSEYARRGFGELLAVAFFSLLMILGLGSITIREDKRQQTAYSWLSITIVVLVIVMLVSAYDRLVLYEKAYGFTELRTYTHVFLVWIGLLLGAVVVLEILHRERAFALAMLCASLGFAITLSLLNVDAFVVKQNVALAVQGQRNLDVQYLAGLSTDEVPILVDDFFSPSLPTGVHEAIGATLICRHQNKSNPSTGDWRSFSFSKWNADRAIEKVLPQISNGYSFNETDSKAYTPGTKAYDCFPYSGD